MSRARLFHRVFLVAPLAALLGVVGATAAGAQEATIEVSPATVAAGGSVTFAGVVPTSGDAACPTDDVATLTSDAALFPPDGFGPDLIRDATGSFDLAYVVDGATPVGVYEVGVRCGGGNVGIAASLEVTAAASSTAAPVSTTDAVVATAPDTTATTTAPEASVTATAVAVSSAVTATSTDDNGGGVHWWILGVLGAALIGVMFVARVARPPGK